VTDEICFSNSKVAVNAPDRVSFEAQDSELRGLARWQLIRELNGLVPDSLLEDSSEGDERDDTPPRRLSSAIEFDAHPDRRYATADVDERFSFVAHVFHQAWHGIRSAAGALPGHKIALPLDRDLRRREIFAVLAHLESWGTKKVVFHGYSYAADRILRAISSSGIACYLVWHGNLSQLAWKPEVLYFERAMAACKAGRFRRAHMLKEGVDAVFPSSYAPMLLNSPPVTGRKRLLAPFAGEHTVALVPAFTDVRKNLHTSLVGAASSRALSEVLHYANVRGSIPLLEKRCRRIHYAGHDRHLAFLHDVDVTVNVTSIDCHPMVDLEAIASGAMAVTGRLFLDALQSHPFTALSTVENPFNTREIANRLDYLITMDDSELRQIIGDYVEQLTALSHDRYSEFLGL
jgi:hypothetical protein